MRSTDSIPQPTTPFSANVTPFTFRDETVLALAEKVNVFGHSRKAIVKPKRASQGLIWNGRTFYWCKKGFYRGGRNGIRRTLQQAVWEHANNRMMPAAHVVTFKDGNRNNFAPKNLALKSKAEIGTANQRFLSYEVRAQIRAKWACKVSKSKTALLLNNFNQKDKHEITNTITTLRARRFRTDPR